jgi:hypothetical protein
MEKYNEFRTQIQGTMLLVPKQGMSSLSPVQDGPPEDPCIEQVNAIAGHMADLDNYMETWSIRMVELLEILQDCRDANPWYAPNQQAP